MSEASRAALEIALAEAIHRARNDLNAVTAMLQLQAAMASSLNVREALAVATKYRALPVSEGRVEVRWRLRRGENGARVADITWRERGGPPVTLPRDRGFGSRLLERRLTQDVDSEVKLDFHPAGLECLICLPIVDLRFQNAGVGGSDGELLGWSAGRSTQEWLALAGRRGRIAPNAVAKW